MTIRLFLAMMAIAAIVAGCSSAKSSYEEVDFADALTADPDTFQLDVLMWPSGMKATGGNLVVQNMKRDTIFDLFTLPDVVYSGSGIIKGSGPDEVIAALPLSLNRGFQSGQLTFSSGLPSQVAVMRVPGFRITDNRRHEMPDGWVGEQNMMLLCGDTVLAQQFTLPLDWIIVDGTGNVVTTLDIPMPDDIKTAAGNDERARMMSRTAYAVPLPDRSRFAICTRVYPSVSIFDREGRNITTLTMPYAPVLKGNYITSCDANEQGIYLVYHDVEKGMDDGYVIAAIDWDGNLMKAYNVPGPIGAVTVDDESNAVYFTGDGYDNCIYRVNL